MGRCVNVSDTRITWYTAQENCEKHDGHLYVGSTAEEMLTLKTAINNLGKCGTVNTVGIYMMLYQRACTKTPFLFVFDIIPSRVETKPFVDRQVPH